MVIFLRAKNLTIGGVRATVIGTLMGNRALLQSTESAKAPPVEAASSAARFCFFSSTPKKREREREREREGKKRIYKAHYI